MSEYTATPGADGTYPVEQKVTAAVATTAILGFLADAISNAVQNTDTAVLFNFLPEWLEPVAVAAFLGIPTYLAGWRAKHQSRIADRAVNGGVL